MSDYSNFLAAKSVTASAVGREVPKSAINPALFDYQRAAVRWALAKGRAALFFDTGLGKTLMQLEWARLAADTSLILAPLAVAQQTVNEAASLLGVTVTLCESAADVRPGLNITNYEKLHHFDPAAFGALVLDESSILKAFAGATRQELTTFAEGIPFRLACTATPSPNDDVEMTNHAEFLGVMQGKEVIALFFTQDGNTTHSWRLKGHAKADYWKWLSSWALACRKPSDLGFSDDGYALPPLTIHQEVVEDETPVDGALFVTEAESLLERQRARKRSLPARVERCAARVNASDEPWIIWCDLNDEGDALRAAIPGAVEVRGSDTPEHKAKAMLDFAAGRIRVLITKTSIAGFGMNWQHCARQAFVGLSDSFERFYQGVRRSWRFGQKRPVEVYVYTSAAEGAVVRNVQAKEQAAREMMDNLIREGGGQDLASAAPMTRRNEMIYATDIAHGRDWTLHLGDSIETIDRIASESVGMSIFSPPFPGMYAYTNSARDIGNTRDIDEFMEHFRYLVGPDKLMRVLMPGRLVCIHLMQLTAMLSRDGWIGLKDYRGKTIEMMTAAGWNYAGEVTIDKNPQVQATRNKERGLLFKSLATDASMMRMALADYLIYFRKPGTNPEPIRAGISNKYNPNGGWITEAEWIEWASPVWYRQTAGLPGGIRETDVLNVAQARDTDDERHLCPLQLGVIERAVKLWSNPGDLVYSAFTGIGSEGFKALQLRRRFVGGELKTSYWQGAVRNLRAAEAGAQQFTLFDDLTLDEFASAG